MATLLEFPVQENRKTVPMMPSSCLFWRTHEIQDVTALLQGEFPKLAALDIGSAIGFAKVVLHPSSGRNGLAQYVRRILNCGSERLAA